MILCIIGIGIFLLGMKKYLFCFSLQAVCAVLGSAFLIVGLFIPVDGYTQWQEIEKTQLSSFSEDITFKQDDLIYLIYSSDGEYTYRCKTDSKVENKTISKDKNVEKIEDANCEVPVLTKYTRSGIPSIWSFALLSNEYKYEFYIPEGSILEN